MAEVIGYLREDTSDPLKTISICAKHTWAAPVPGDVELRSDDEDLDELRVEGVTCDLCGDQIIAAESNRDTSR